MRPRVLVVRSGPRSVLDGGAPPEVEVVERASHVVEPVDATGAGRGAVPDLAVFTSSTAVAFALGPEAPAGLARRVAGARIAAVGGSTAAALGAAGLPAAIVAGGSARALLGVLPEALAGQRVLWPCGEDSSETFSRELSRRGADVERRVLYRKTPVPPDSALAHEIVDGSFAAFAATSPAALGWLWDVAAEPGRARLRGTPAVALGPSTRAAMDERGIARVAVADAARFDVLLRLLAALAVPTPPK